MSKLTYLIKRATSMDLNGLKERLRQVHKINGKPKAWILLDMLICGIRYEAGYIDYTIFGMYDMNHEQRKNILTRGKNTKYVMALNKREDYHYFNNKPEFLTLFAEECGRDHLNLNQGDVADFEAFIEKHPVFMAKPEAGLCGKGIEKIDSTGESPISLYNSLKTNGQTLLEEVLLQHKKVDALYPGSINTVRMVTMTDDEGEPHLLYAAMRLGSGGAVVDNFNSGGMVIPVDPEKGTLIGVAVNKASHTFEAHPDTGVKFEGYQLPCWATCRKLAFKAAVRVPTVRFVGWDLAITPNGPVLVEGNHYPGHDIYQLVAQNPEKKGMLPVFDAVVPYSSLKNRKTT